YGPGTAVVPSKDGTHNHREWLRREQAVAAEQITNACGYGSRRSPGRREKVLIQFSNSSPLSSSGLTGRSSIPEATVLEPRSRGVLDARRSLSSGGAYAPTRWRA